MSAPQAHAWAIVRPLYDQDDDPAWRAKQAAIWATVASVILGGCCWLAIYCSGYPSP